jgi:succinate-semialdehyde dehydrogenase/glutarate-semialdehyde dehydrogenase
MNELFLEGKVFVGGKWVDSVSGKIFKVYNPADGSLVGSVADFSMQQADEAILAANVAIIEWKKKSGKQRSLVLRKWFDLVIENQQELALILTKEQGKPLAEAEAEIRYAASFIEWFAEEANEFMVM